MSHQSKLKREQHGPGWLEIIFGAGLSLVLGVLLGAAHLVFKPVALVKELPKDASDSALYPMVYFIAGGTGGGSAWKSKQSAFVSGSAGGITVSEQELNAFVAAAAPPPPKPPAPPAAPPPVAPADKTKPAAPAFTTATLDPGVINFRLYDGTLQAAMAGNFNVIGLGLAPLVQVRGAFVRGATGFQLQPTEFYLGSLPLHHLPGMAGWLFNRMLAAQTGVPTELEDAWHKLGNVAVDGDTLKLSP